MPGEAKSSCADDLRHAEYYSTQSVHDEFYRRSRDGEVFTNLADIVTRRENILLAYRNIKVNEGSYTTSTNNRSTIGIRRMTPEEIAEKARFIATGSRHDYRPRPVRCKDILELNGKIRSLGIPCIWDRLVQ